MTSFVAGISIGIAKILAKSDGPQIKTNADNTEPSVLYDVCSSRHHKLERDRASAKGSFSPYLPSEAKPIKYKSFKEKCCNWLRAKSSDSVSKLFGLIKQKRRFPPLS